MTLKILYNEVSGTRKFHFVTGTSMYYFFLFCSHTILKGQEDLRLACNGPTTFLICFKDISRRLSAYHTCGRTLSIRSGFSPINLVAFEHCPPPPPAGLRYGGIILRAAKCDSSSRYVKKACVCQHL